ncbi:MAG: LysR family transcriptional regulator [Mycobacteriales bacterium]
MLQVVRRRVDWSDLRVFWAVAELGSFGAAARALKLGLTTVTRSVDRLEGQLGARLLARGPQGVTLTEAGSAAYDRALSMERIAAQLEHEIADSDNAAEGRVKLAAPDGIAGIFLSPSIAEFVRANPKIDLVLDCELWPDRPLSGEIDIALTFDEPKNADAIAIPLADFHYALFASQDYLDLYGSPKSPAEIPAHPYVHHVGQTANRAAWKPGSVALQDFIGKRLETNSSAVSFAAVKHGAGIGAMPTAILSLEPSLVMLEESPQESIKLWLVHHRDVARAARIKRVIAWLKDVFDARAKPWYRAEFIHPRDFAAYLGVDAKPSVPAAAEDPAERRRRRAAAAR